jgi:hypothetical protein
VVVVVVVDHYKVVPCLKMGLLQLRPNYEYASYTNALCIHMLYRTPHCQSVQSVIKILGQRFSLYL